jgi:hypothetical protein
MAPKRDWVIRFRKRGRDSLAASGAAIRLGHQSHGCRRARSPAALAKPFSPVVQRF